MHLGNARTALLAWLDARSRDGGVMLLRIEDLDRHRCRPEFAELVRQRPAVAGAGLGRRGAPAVRPRRRLPAGGRPAGALGAVYECFCSRRELDAQSAPHGPDGERRYPGTCAHLTLRASAPSGPRARAPALRVRMPGRRSRSTTVCQGPIRQQLDRRRWRRARAAIRRAVCLPAGSGRRRCRRRRHRRRSWRRSGVVDAAADGAGWAARAAATDLRARAADARQRRSAAGQAKRRLLDRRAA